MPHQEGKPRSAAQATGLETRTVLLSRLDRTVAQLIGIYQGLANPATSGDDAWTAKDILCHITFWHESFARNVSALVSGNAPTPLRGTYADLNRRSVAEMQGLTSEQIVERLRAAHQLIQLAILSPHLKTIPYRKGSRDYTPEEHLAIVCGHIAEHLRAIEKIRNGAQQASG